MQIEIRALKSAASQRMAGAVVFVAARKPLSPPNRLHGRE